MNEFSSETSTDYRNDVLPIDPQNPFENPTEYREYNKDYSDIVPQLSIPGCQIPLMPSKAEKKRIRRHFNIAGMWLIIHFAIITLLGNGLVYVLLNLIQKTADVDKVIARQYISDSSVYIGAVTISYLTANLLVFFFGCKTEKIKISSLFKTTDLTIPRLLQYASIGFMIQTVMGLASMLISIICPDISIMISDSSSNSTANSLFVDLAYTCIIAPITEELLFRGFLLKTCSRISQRFGILMSALLFGLLHGNIAQFLLAFTVGIFMAHIDIKHNSLIPSMTVHFCLNTFVSIVNLFVSNDGSITIPLIILSLIQWGFVITGLVMFIFFRRKNKLPFTTPHQKMRTSLCATTSWGLIGIIVLYCVVFASYMGLPSIIFSS